MSESSKKPALPEDVIEISDDEEIEEIITDLNDTTNVNDKKFIEDNSELKIKEEVMEEVIEISDDVDTEETITDRKDTIKFIDKKDVGVQVNFNSNENSNSCSKSNEASSSHGAGLLIKPLNSSTEDENILLKIFRHLPRYPPSPKYPPDVSKPPVPLLKIEKKIYVDGTQGIVLSWSFACKNPDNIVGYELFSYYEGSAGDTSNDWKKLGYIEAQPLPMVTCLTHFVFSKAYYFIVRAVDSEKKLGDFSAPAGIILHKLNP